MLSENLKMIQNVRGRIYPGITDTPLKVWVDEFILGDSEPEKVSEYRPSEKVNTITIARLPVNARIMSIKIKHQYKDVSIDVGVSNYKKAFVDGFDSNEGELNCNAGRRLGKQLKDVDRVSDRQEEVDIFVTLTGDEIKGGMSIIIEYT